MRSGGRRSRPDTSRGLEVVTHTGSRVRTRCGHGGVGSARSLRDGRTLPRRELPRHQPPLQPRAGPRLLRGLPRHAREAEPVGRGEGDPRRGNRLPPAQSAAAVGRLTRLYSQWGFPVAAADRAAGAPHGHGARASGGPTAHPPCGNFRAYTYLHEKGSQITRCIALGATRGVYHTHTHTHFAKRERRPRPARRWQRRRASRRPSRRRQSSVA